MCADKSDGFNSTLWKAQHGKHERHNPRGKMIVSLEKNHLRPGMMRAEVHALLGEPDQKRGTSDVYNLGASPVGVDFEYYVLEYDSAERLSKFWLTRG